VTARPARVLPVPGLLGRSLAALTGPGRFGGRGGLPLVERNVLAYRHLWIVLVSGVLEPLFYLLSIRVGLGALVGHVTGPGGRVVPYAVFVAPALLASASMNGAVFDSTYNVFHKLKYDKVYDAALATPLRPGDVALGEITWALGRGLLYAIAFLVVLAAMGLVRSGWVLLSLPVAVLIGFAFAGVGVAATTYMRSWKDFDFIILAVQPMFLFSATFYPLSVYPGALRTVVECTPLYQAVALLRGMSLGELGPAMIGHAAYLAVMGLAGLYVAGQRIGRLLLA